VGHEKVGRLPFCTCPCCCISFCIYAMLRTGATFSWPTLRVGDEKVACTAHNTHHSFKHFLPILLNI